MNTDNNRFYKNLILSISIIIPLAVALLIYLPFKLELGIWVKQLPKLNAVINSLTALLLVFAVVSIKMKRIALHQLFMSASFVLGSIFLLSYVLYHASVDSVMFGDVNGDKILSDDELLEVGSLRGIYLFILISHILLSIVVVPLVLMSFYYSLQNNIHQHKRVVKFSFPIWLYVSITGVITYIMISPYYN